MAREHADNSIAELDKEIENLLFETRVRKEVVSDTVATLLERAAAKGRVHLPYRKCRPSIPIRCEVGVFITSDQGEKAFWLFTTMAVLLTVLVGYLRCIDYKRIPCNPSNKTSTPGGRH